MLSRLFLFTWLTAGIAVQGLAALWLLLPGRAASAVHSPAPVSLLGRVVASGPRAYVLRDLTGEVVVHTAVPPPAGRWIWVAVEPQRGGVLIEARRLSGF